MAAEAMAPAARVERSLFDGACAFAALGVFGAEGGGPAGLAWGCITGRFGAGALLQADAARGFAVEAAAPAWIANVRALFADEAEISCRDPVDFPNAPLRHAAGLYHEYMAKSMFYFQSPARSTFGSVSCDGQRWVTCAPAGFDVLRREEILMAWREKWARRLGWWTDAWAGYLARRQERMAGGVITASIGSFAAAPAG